MTPFKHVFRGWTLVLAIGASLGSPALHAADKDDWWVTEIRTYDGFPDGEWIDYAAVRQPLGEMFRTPRGETFEEDVRLEKANVTKGLEYLQDKAVIGRLDVSTTPPHGSRINKDGES